MNIIITTVINIATTSNKTTANTKSSIPHHHHLQRGDRECHIVVLTDDDVVDWDGDYPPHLGDECPQGLFFLFLLTFFNHDMFFL